MTTLTLAKLAQIEAAAEDALKWRALTGDGRYLSNVCDPATVAALCQAARERDALAALLKSLSVEVQRTWYNADSYAESQRGLTCIKRKIDAALAEARVELVGTQNTADNCRVDNDTLREQLAAARALLQEVLDCDQQAIPDWLANDINAALAGKDAT